MCRILALASRRPRPPVELLGERAVKEFVALSHEHPDGWGVAWVDGRGDGVHTERSVEPAYADSRLVALLHETPATGLFLHLRWATPGFPVSLPNTHPFRDGERVAFAHNGALRAGEALEGLVPPRLRDRRRGTSDSEAYFLRFLGEWRDDVSGGLARAVESVTDVCTPSGLNAVVLTPTTLAAVCWYDPASPPPHPDPAGGPPHGSAQSDPDYYTLRVWHMPDAVVIASSGWPRGGGPEGARGGHEVLPNGSVLTCPLDTLATETRVLGPHKSASA
ncbi:MAG: class II glutamine amidotransferase [Streptosporangiaceae bacterium]